MRSFESLSAREILALAISLEEEDERIYADYAEELKQDFPATAAMFGTMRQEESDHRRRLIELYQAKFGEHIPLIRRNDVKGFVHRRPIWLTRPLRLDAVRREAATMEVETRRFYEKSAARTEDASIRQLLNDLAQEERSHEYRAEELSDLTRPPAARRKRPTANSSCCRSSSPAWSGSWTDLSPLWRRYSPQPLPRAIRTSRSPSAWLLPSARASAWDLPKRSLTTAASPVAAIPGFVAWSADS